MTIERKSTSQLIVDHLLGQIYTGELRSRDKLPPKRELAEKLGVSRILLREAIRSLSILGIIDLSYSS